MVAEAMPVAAEQALPLGEAVGFALEVDCAVPLCNAGVLEAAALKLAVPQGVCDALPVPLPAAAVALRRAVGEGGAV